VVRNTLALPASCAPGIAFTGKKVLQWSIIALGFGLSLDQVAKTGFQSLAVTLVTMSVAFLAAWLLGRWLHVRGKLAVLIGVGTAICGGSAIAAATPIIRADDHDTAFAISTIFLFNVIAVLLFPLLGHLRMRAHESSEQLAHAIIAHGIAGANVQLPAQHLAALRCAPAKFGMPVQQLAGQWQELAAARVQAQAATLAGKDRASQLALHLCQRHARRRLAEMKVVRRAPHAAVQGHFDKDFELARADPVHQR
jgi:predicted Na+-dependent transporter